MQPAQTIGITPTLPLSPGQTSLLAVISTGTILEPELKQPTWVEAST